SRGEKVAVRVAVRRRDLPSFPLDGVRVEDRPHWPGAIIGRLRVLVHRHGRVEKVVLCWTELDILAVAIVVWRIRVDLMSEVAVRRITLGFIVKSLADLIH